MWTLFTAKWRFKKFQFLHVYYLGWNRSPAQVGCMRQVLRPGALGRTRGIGWRGRWEGGLGWGIHVNPWLIHFNVWQNPLQYCKVISLQLIKKLKKCYLKLHFNMFSNIGWGLVKLEVPIGKLKPPSYTLVGMQNGAASWKTLWQFLKWSTVIIWLHFYSLLCNQEITPIIVHKYSQKQYSWELLSTNNAHVHHETDEILFGNRRELRTNTCYWYNMNNPCKHCAEWKKPITKDYILYDYLCKVLFSVLSNSLRPHGL